MTPMRHRAAWFGYETFTVASDTMAPAVKDGDTVLSDSWFYRDHPPTPGEIAVIVVRPDLHYIRRIQAVSDAGVTLAADAPNPSPGTPMTLAADHLAGRVVGIVFSRDFNRVGLKIAQPDEAKPAS